MSCDAQTLINAAYAAGWAKLSDRLLKESIAVSSSASSITTVMNWIYSAGYPKMSVRDVMEGQVSQSCASGTGCTAATVESTNATNGYSKLSTGDLVRAALAESCAGASPTFPDILHQDFESGVRPSGWTDFAGAPNYGYSPALLGNFSLYNEGNEIAVAISRASLGGSYSEVYLFMMFKALGDLGHQFLTFRNTANNSGELILFPLFGKLFVAQRGDSNDAATVANFNTGTLYYIWVHYKAGSGANGIVSVGFSTTLSEPTSGDNFATLTNANSTFTIDTIEFASMGGPVLYDHVGVSTTDSMATGW